jgi:hypothetical protein
VFGKKVSLMACSSSLEDSNEGVSLTFKTRFYLQLVLSRQAYVAETPDQHMKPI